MCNNKSLLAQQWTDGTLFVSSHFPSCSQLSRTLLSLDARLFVFSPTPTFDIYLHRAVGVSMCALHILIVELSVNDFHFTISMESVIFSCCAFYSIINLKFCEHTAAALEAIKTIVRPQLAYFIHECLDAILFFVCIAWATSQIEHSRSTQKLASIYVLREWPSHINQI